MKLTPTPDRRAKCKAKDIAPGNCLMKYNEHVVYMVTDRSSGSDGCRHLVNMENGKTSIADPQDLVFIIDAGPLCWTFRMIE